MAIRKQIPKKKRRSCKVISRSPSKSTSPSFFLFSLKKKNNWTHSVRLLVFHSLFCSLLLLASWEAKTKKFLFTSMYKCRERESSFGSPNWNAVKKTTQSRWSQDITSPAAFRHPPPVVKISHKWCYFTPSTHRALPLYQLYHYASRHCNLKKRA